MHTFATPGPVVLRVKNGGGLVDVRAADTTETTVHLKALNEAGEDAVAEAHVTHDRDTVVVDIPRRVGLLRRGPEVVVEVSVPTGTTLDVDTQSSDIRATGSYADASCTTGSGDVAVDDVQGAARVKSGSGDLSLGAVTGQWEAATGSGDVSVDEAGHDRGRATSGSGRISIGRLDGEVSAKTGSGDVEIGVLNGELDSKSGSGDLVVRRATSGRLRSSGASGDVSIGVEAGTAAWLDITSHTGRVRQELGDAPAPAEGQPTVEISVKAVTGNLRIHRA